MALYFEILATSNINRPVFNSQAWVVFDVSLIPNAACSNSRLIHAP
jgi:hypothetical protein